jgi:three-Cys-motif partner protein
MRSNKFNKLYYVDPFSGSGILKLKKKYLFPGSPLIPLFQRHKTPFHKYYLSDNSTQYINVLKNNVNRILQNEDVDIKIDKINFADRIREIFSGEKPNYWKEVGSLVFLDPYGLQVDWESMERILRSGAVDIIFTFMTWAIMWNRNNELAEDSLTKYFGNTGWKNLRGSEEFVEHYCKQIQQYGYINKYKTFTIDVIQEGGRRYDLILATQSPGASNVLTALKERVKLVNTGLLGKAFSVTVGEQSDLHSF